MQLLYSLYTPISNFFLTRLDLFHTTLRYFFYSLEIMLSNASILRKAATTAIRRSMATEAAHKPPLDLYGLNARYANATYVAASKSNTLEQVESELLAIKNSATTSKAFASFLENPLISRDDKTKSVEDMLKGKTSSVTLNLMTVLAGNARLNAIVGIADTYVQLMKAKRGEVEATIISAEPLNKTQTAAVQDAMKSQFPAGAKVVLETKVDPSILGGLQIQIGDKFLDLSVGSRIEEVGRTAV
mmetsp:Transcript_15947/g.26165  ORF Transcript_15947/g.26165 Transcript_15947/m.26165 type:complete len:244 (-) Transcript_15947:205-936(-)